MQSLEWIEAWQHGMACARREDQLLPPDAHLFLISHGLPRVVVFESQNSFEISFASLGKELVCYNSVVRWGGIVNEELDNRWSQQVVIGDEEFCNGHASYCVHQELGMVSRIDCELTESEVLVNSSVATFGMSLLVAKQWSEAIRNSGCDVTVQSFDDLETKLAKIDPAIFELEHSFWHDLIRLYREDEMFDLLITNDPAYSKPRF